jgi:Oxidoreductase family, NAD-binding Rossmann fold
VLKANLDSTRDRFRIDGGRAYWGPEPYRELAQSKLDAVVIETPPYYHAIHAAAAVDAGRHVFCAKTDCCGRADLQGFLEERRQGTESKSHFLG